MCEANDSLPSSTRVWPPPEGAAGENFDEMWDDCELLAKYAQVEMQVKAQVEAYCSGKVPLPPPPPTLPSAAAPGVKASTTTTAAPAKDGAACLPASSRKKRRNHNKNKGKGGPVEVGGYTGNEAHFPLCSQCSHAGYAEYNNSNNNNNNNNGGSANQWISPSAGAVATDLVSGNFQQPYSAVAPPTSSSSSPPSGLPCGGVAAPGVAPIYSLLLPNYDLHPDLLPPPLPQLTTCNCSHQHFQFPSPSKTPPPAQPAAASSGSGSGSGSGMPANHSSAAASALQPILASLPLNNSNGEITTAVLLRAWYEAGYAMGQAHAEQFLSLRPSAIETPVGEGQDGVTSEEAGAAAPAGDDVKTERQEETKEVPAPTTTPKTSTKSNKKKK